LSLIHNEETELDNIDKSSYSENEYDGEDVDFDKEIDSDDNEEEFEETETKEGYVEEEIY